MKYRLIATILLVIAVVATGVALEPSTTTNPAPAAASSPDDATMKNLRIN